ncbi:MAG: histone deacetylase [Acidobacteria bacterium]|nr:MAG: histone deacetylase [Acidobacteriota bacterium]
MVEPGGAVHLPHEVRTLHADAERGFPHPQAGEAAGPLSPERGAPRRRRLADEHPPPGADAAVEARQERPAPRLVQLRCQPSHRHEDAGSGPRHPGGEGRPAHPALQPERGVGAARLLRRPRRAIQTENPHRAERTGRGRPGRAGAAADVDHPSGRSQALRSDRQQDVVNGHVMQRGPVGGERGALPPSRQGAGRQVGAAPASAVEFGQRLHPAPDLGEGEELAPARDRFREPRVEQVAFLPGEVSGDQRDPPAGKRRGTPARTIMARPDREARGSGLPRWRRSAAGAMTGRRSTERRGPPLPPVPCRPFFLGGWLARRRALFVHGPEYSQALPSSDVDRHRGERILAFLDSRGLLPSRVVRPPPASVRDLEEVHDPTYVAALESPETARDAFGFELDPPQLDRIVAMQRAMAGGTVLAARAALGRRPLAVNLGGGLHHARRARAGGFCLVNDIGVAVAALRREGFDGRVLVVDLDMHDGDGTRLLFAGDATVHTFSIHADHWAPTAAVESTSVSLGHDVGDAELLGALRRELPAILLRFRPRLVFYVAGVDGAASDPRGTWRLTPEGLLARDLAVYQAVRRAAGRPGLVVLLGGGYGPDAWRPTARWLGRILSGGRRDEPPPTEELVLGRYRAAAQRLDEELLAAPRGGEGLLLTAEDIAPALGLRTGADRFLGFYSPHGVEVALERLGLLERIRQLGFAHPVLEFDLSGEAGQVVRLYGDPDRRELLGELRARSRDDAVPGFRLLAVEWLLLQNPRAVFPPDRPPLPGQQHPGLGLLRDVVALLVLACERLGLDGLLFVPAHYHMAAQSSRLLRFLDPERQGRFEAMRQRLAGMPLAVANRLLEEGRVVDAATGRPVRWEPAPMVLAVSPALKERIGGEEYERKRAAAREAARFVIRPNAAED